MRNLCLYIQNHIKLIDMSYYLLNNNKAMWLIYDVWKLRNVEYEVKNDDVLKKWTCYHIISTQWEGKVCFAESEPKR